MCQWYRKIRDFKNTQNHFKIRQNDTWYTQRVPCLKIATKVDF